MTRWAWVLNLDAEFELAALTAPSPYVPKRALLEQLERHGQASRVLLGEGDVLIRPGERPAQALSDFIGRAWSPTPLAAAALTAAGVSMEPHPEARVLRRVNHRRFACEVGGGLPDQHYFTEQAQVEERLADVRQPWLLKRPLAFAGRGQMRFYGPLSDKHRSWLRASFAGDGLVMEPLVVPTLECSLHGFLWPDGRARFGRACVQEVSARGVFRGVRPAEAHELTADERAALDASGERVSAALTKAGYFGPFGVDAYRYERGAKVMFCALGEINARYTMGFAVGFPRGAREFRL